MNAFIMYKLPMNYLKIEGYDSKRNQRDPDNMAAGGTPSLFNIHGTTTKILYSKVIGIEELADALKNKVFWRPLHVSSAPDKIYLVSLSSAVQLQ